LSALATASRFYQGINRLYAPPEGYSDFPFTWIFDGPEAGLVADNNYPNQFIDVQSGWGDFIARRVLGLDTMLLTGPNGGQFQIKDARGRYLQSLPQYAGNNSGGFSLSQSMADMAIVPEILYRELTNISFDLYGYSGGIKPSGAVTGAVAQLAFQGVRRVKTVPTSKYTFRPKPYTYVTYGALLGGTGISPTNATSVIQAVNNYDFDLYQIFAFFAPMLEFVEEGTAAIFFQPQNPPLVPPQLVTITITSSVGDNLPLTVTVSGYAITIQAATNSVGQVISTAAQVAAAINANPAASQLVIATAVSPVPSLVITPTGLGPSPLVGATLSQNTPWAKMLLFDQNSVQVYSEAMLDLFVNAGSYYKGGGGVVTPLHYAQNSRIRMDITPLLWVGLETQSTPLWATLHYVGEQRIPC